MKLLGKRTRKGEEGAINLVPEEGQILQTLLLLAFPSQSLHFCLG